MGDILPLQKKFEECERKNTLSRESAFCNESQLRGGSIWLTAIVPVCFQNQLGCHNQGAYLLLHQSARTNKLGEAFLGLPHPWEGGKVFCRSLLREKGISFKKDLFSFPICFFSQYNLESNQVLQHSEG